MPQQDWYAWHDRYGEPGSTLALRLTVVQEQVRSALDRAPVGPLRVLSLCAGQGRDLLGVLPEHPRRGDVTARLVELDPRNAAAAADAARAAGLDRVEVLVGDAALTDHHVGMVPADLVLVCGIFGNISDADVEHVIGCCAQLCRTGATVVWTRHRRPPDLVPRICKWFEESGFEVSWFSGDDAGYGVGAHRFVRQPRPLTAGARMFTFVR